MADQITPTSSSQGIGAPDLSARIFATADEYMAQYAHDYYEWVDGVAINLRPFRISELDLSDYFDWLLSAYFALNPIGTVRRLRFLMQLPGVGTYRKPDLKIILNDNPGQFTDTAMIGPADICIEVVSLESVERDFGKKFEEYEAAGVKEYWIADPIRHETRFCRLNAEGRYQTQLPDAEGTYQTPLLPGLRLHVPTLWREPLPDIISVVEAVKAMLAK